MRHLQASGSHDHRNQLKPPEKLANLHLNNRKEDMYHPSQRQRLLEFRNLAGHTLSNLEKRWMFMSNQFGECEVIHASN